MELPQQNGTAADSERAFLPAPQTRTSFMATWATVAGATGYRLDVSSSPRFETYVDGYRDLDVGNVIGRVVTQLKQGTTYYYRVRAYNASGSGGSDSAANDETATGEGGDEDSGEASAATASGEAVGNPNVLIDTSTVGNSAAQIDTPVISGGNSSLWQGADGVGDTPGGNQ